MPEQSMDDLVQEARQLVEEYDALKPAWDDLRRRVQAMDDRLQAIVQEALHGDGDIESAKRIMVDEDIAGRVSGARTTMERIWWDPRRKESLLDKQAD